MFIHFAELLLRCPILFSFFCLSLPPSLSLSSIALAVPLLESQLQHALQKSASSLQTPLTTQEVSVNPTAVLLYSFFRPVPSLSQRAMCPLSLTHRALCGLSLTKGCVFSLSLRESCVSSLCSEVVFLLLQSAAASGPKQWAQLNGKIAEADGEFCSFHNVGTDAQQHRGHRRSETGM